MKLLARLWTAFWIKLTRDDRTDDEWKDDQL